MYLPMTSSPTCSTPEESVNLISKLVICAFESQTKVEMSVYIFLVPMILSVSIFGRFSVMTDVSKSNSTSRYWRQTWATRHSRSGGRWRRTRSSTRDWIQWTPMPMRIMKKTPMMSQSISFAPKRIQKPANSMTPRTCTPSLSFWRKKGLQAAQTKASL